MVEVRLAGAVRKARLVAAARRAVEGQKNRGQKAEGESWPA